MTGHTGFKGSWMSFALAELGASVTGYALAPDTDPNLFSILKLRDRVQHHINDVRDIDALRSRIRDAQPEVAFHLAAQPLVRRSYQDPLETFSTNVMGTANFLQACRGVDSLRAIVVITTDKVYENKEWQRAYHEDDRLGGHDPYSTSKACAELVTTSYRQCFFEKSESALVASARAGNVIGGGDWSVDRLIPDLIRAMAVQKPLEIRSPMAIRPWQHVLEPISGYLTIAERLLHGDSTFARGFNLGPKESDCIPVREMLQLANKSWQGGIHWKETVQENAPHEAGILKLDCTLAVRLLEWQPKWDVQHAVQLTCDWYQAWLRRDDLVQLTRQQWAQYLS